MSLMSLFLHDHPFLPLAAASSQQQQECVKEGRKIVNKYGQQSVFHLLRVQKGGVQGALLERDPGDNKKGLERGKGFR